MFTDEALKQAISKYYETSGSTKKFDADKAISDVRSKLKNNTMDELKLALKELKLEMTDEKSAVASIGLLGLVGRIDTLVAYAAANLRKAPTVDEQKISDINKELVDLNSRIRIEKNTTVQTLEERKKYFQTALNGVYKELDKLDNYDPIADNNASLEVLLSNPELVSMSEMDLALMDPKKGARPSKYKPYAAVDNYNTKMPAKAKSVLEKTFGPIQWSKNEKGYFRPVLTRKRIVFELMKGKSVGQIPGATGLGGSYRTKMLTLKAKKNTYQQIVAELNAVINNLWNRGKNLAVEQHIDSELRTGFYHVETSFIKSKVEQLGEEMKQVISIIAENKLQGKDVVSMNHQQELYDNLIDAGIEQDSQMSDRWNMPIGEKSNFNYLTEAEFFSSDFESASVHSRTVELATTPVRAESNLPTSLWNVPDVAGDDKAKFQVAKMPVSFTKGRVIYDFLTKDDANTKAVDDYKWLINNQEQKTAQDSRNQYVGFGSTAVSKAALARQQGLHWKIYWAISRPEVARNQELAGEDAPMKQYEKSTGAYARMALTTNTSVPDFILMYMVQYDNNDVVRTAARTALLKRGWEIAKDKKGNIIKNELQPDVQEYGWTRVNPKRKSSSDPWLSYFAQVPTPAAAVSSSGRLQQVQQQQALDLAAKTEAQTAQKKAEEDKKALLQNQQKKDMSTKEPVTQPNPPQAPDETEAKGVKPGSKLPPQMAISSISRRDMK